ncbi:hypothetical protein [Bathymodiolus japonicus methanotrophic gill symbiont]|uniref:hypothetical protein n=1 Tax=Bathymodiolus japonicus methanotrophic gill symbiont TaxID=113269 RepID=UPI001C8CF9FC|nr:hypothetical protein [Bathymodiolus japonicus methanotrophic gill symbiont]
MAFYFVSTFAIAQTPTKQRPYGYRGLKIFTSLKLRFQDFQRQVTVDFYTNICSFATEPSFAPTCCVCESGQYDMKSRRPHSPQSLSITAKGRPTNPLSQPPPQLHEKNR